MHAVETMAYNKAERPWHGLGKAVSNDMTPEEMLVASGTNWTVSKRKIFIEGNEKGKMTPLPNRYALVRDSDGRVLDTHLGSLYKPVQNAEIARFFEKFTKAGHMTMETMGSLQQGRYVWALAKIGKGFKLAGGDEVEGYLLFSQPHVLLQSLQIKFTPIRVVCWNTLSLALNKNLNSATSAFRMTHVRQFNDKMRDKAEEALGLAKGQMDRFQAVAKLLSETHVKREKDKLAYFEQVFGGRKKQGDAERTIKAPVLDDEKQSKAVRLAIEAEQLGPGATLKTAASTYWGLLNAVTYVVDHRLGNTADKRMADAWLGKRRGVKARALQYALVGAVGEKEALKILSA